MSEPERIQTVVRGAGQAGLSTGHSLARHGCPHVILEARQRVGDSFTGYEPGLSFVGVHCLYALSSTMIHGVERVATHVADTIASRTGRGRLSPVAGGRGLTRTSGLRI